MICLDGTIMGLHYHPTANDYVNGKYVRPNSKFIVNSDDRPVCSEIEHTYHKCMRYLITLYFFCLFILIIFCIFAQILYNMQSCFFFVDADGTENVSNLMPIRHASEPFWVILKKNIVDESSHHNIVSKTVCYDDITELPKVQLSSYLGLN